MKLNLTQLSQSRRSSQASEAGRTLVETMVATALLSLVLAAILSCHLAGLRLTGFVRPKIENSEYARKTVSRIIEEVRCANTVQVGTGTVSGFTVAAANQLQAGNAIRIFPGTNTNSFIYYFGDTNTWTVQRADPLNANTITIATRVTNITVFTMENFGGTVLTNPQNNSVMSVLLQMRRDTTVSGVTDTAQLRSKVTRRNIL